MNELTRFLLSLTAC